jgi:Lrp/AsnC family leucine-responsive transcriptional regulator
VGVEDLDRRIVALLRADGRMSYTDLGKAMGLSTSAVHQRVRRLEERGVVKGYAAIVDFTALDLPLTAYITEIEACHSVAGEENYILKARVRTPGDLETLLARIRAAANVATRTTVVLSTPWE